MIRALIVDDSFTLREAVSERLQTAGIEVVGTAANGQEAIALTHRLRPDVILMDVVMPGIDGLVATRRIMEEIPTPVVILSGHANQDEAFKTYDALAAGALEVCAKPTNNGVESESQWHSILLSVFAAAQVRVTRLRASLIKPRTVSYKDRAAEPHKTSTSNRKVVAIGGSTGGLAAIRTILCGLPHDFPAVVLVALHCSPHLSSSLAQWFDRECALCVRDAKNHDHLPSASGMVITIPPGYNMRVERDCTILEKPDESDLCHPSIDRLFTSVAESYADTAIGVLLTGMGEDGALGLKKIHDSNGATIAQDESTSVVYGMPAAAVRLGAVDHIAAVQNISELLVTLVASPCTSQLCGENKA